MFIRRAIISQGLRAIDAVRADIWLRPLARGRGVILMMHHVRPFKARPFAPNRLLEIPPEFFDDVIGLVKRLGFDIIAMDEVAQRLNAPKTRPFAVLTFDDGYRDNLEFAVPIMRRHGVPATIFVTTSYAEGTGRLWWLELEEAVARLDQIRFSHGGRDFDLPAADPAAKQAAFDKIYWRLRIGPEETLLAAIAELAVAAGIDSPAMTRRLCMNWDELAALAASPDITIGAHTCTHPMLARHAADAARFEIRASREEIEARLRRPVRHFAYPVGDPGSAGSREFRLAREAGYETAVTTRPGHVFDGHRDHLHALPRVSINGLHQDPSAIRSLLSGVPFLLWNRGRRLNVT